MWNFTLTHLLFLGYEVEEEKFILSFNISNHPWLILFICFPKI